MVPPYTLIRSNRKTVSLEITPELTALVRAPRLMSVSKIDEFVAKHTDWIVKHTEVMRQKQTFQNSLTADQISLLQQKARDLLPGKVAFYSRKMNLYPTGVKITSAQKRFGSCSGKNSLCFSYLLMQYPDEAIDYVVVHELAHIRHKNHGASFYALIEQTLPDYRNRWEMLKKRPDISRQNETENL